jgi:flavin reductase (DIM6/NTAB) family NADH-FMN oxidoreductase RutF
MKKSRPPKLSSPGPVHFREALSRFATGVTVVTVGGRKGAPPLGVTISSFAGLSLEPPLVLFCLDEKSRALKSFKKGVSFAVNILAEGQQHYAKHFARSGAQVSKKYPALRTSAPLLEDTAAGLLCTLEKKIKSGDHTIIIGRVKKIVLHPDNPAPLLHAKRKYWSMGKAKR